MARVPLEELVLQIHLLGLGPAAEFLARVIEPPPAKSITGAVSQLQAIGALTPEEAFTPLGDIFIPSPAARCPSKRPKSIGLVLPELLVCCPRLANVPVYVPPTHLASPSYNCFRCVAHCSKL